MPSLDTVSIFIVNEDPTCPSTTVENQVSFSSCSETYIVRISSQSNAAGPFSIYTGSTTGTPIYSAVTRANLVAGESILLYNTDQSGCITPTPTPTPTSTPTVTPTPSVTPSETPASSNTPTPTATPTVTPTVTDTPTQTPTVTPTLTPSITPSITPSLSPTETPTPTVTPSITPSVTITVTPSLTPSLSPTETPTPTVTPTLTPTSSETPTPTVTPTITPSETPTNTPTSSETPTPTVTPTVTPTNTQTPTQTPTETPTQTPTETPTNTPTSTLTPTPTITPTVTPSEVLFAAYIFAEPVDSGDDTTLNTYATNNGANAWYSYQSGGAPPDDNAGFYSSDLDIYAHQPSFINGTGNFVTPISLSAPISQINYLFSTIQVSSSSVNANLQYFYSIWLPLDGIGGSMTTYQVDVGTTSGGNEIFNDTPFSPPIQNAYDVTVTSGAAIPAGTYKVLWITPDFLLPGATPLTGSLYFTGASKS